MGFFPIYDKSINEDNIRGEYKSVGLIYLRLCLKGLEKVKMEEHIMIKCLGIGIDLTFNKALKGTTIIEKIQE